MDYSTLSYRLRGPVAVITYDRQERRNAWNVPMYREAVHAIERANADDGVGAIVLTHAGPVFCSGADFKAAPEPPDPVTGKSPNVATLSMAEGDSWLHLLARSKPVVGAVNGAAIGLGVTQLLGLDMRICGESSTFAFPFLELGVMPELGCTALLSRLVGYGRALDICLTAATLDAAEAERIGLVSRAVPDDAVLDTAIDCASRIAAHPSLQVRLTRALLRDNAAEPDIDAVLRRERAAFETMFRAAKGARAAT